MSAIIEYDDALFRVQIPEFSNTTTYPQVLMQGFWDIAINYISDVNYGFLRDSSRVLALNYMTAHIAKLNLQLEVNPSSVIGQVQGATIDKVTVTLTPPPNPNQFSWWLGLTPYGQMLLALLQVKSVGGMYVGGLPERAAFRKVGGIV